LEKEVYTYLPDIRKLGISDITEDEFYKLVGFTHQEINQIKNPSSHELVDEKEVIEIEVKPKVKNYIIIEDTILCGAILKKKGKTCKNKGKKECNGKCKKHFVLVI
jgi:hypothetical protein